MRLPRITKFALYRENPCLLPLYHATRDPSLAKREWTWICKELKLLYPEISKHGLRKKIVNACQLRARNYPLQYILKSQPFGNIKIDCQQGVLIPRWETEEWVERVVDKLNRLERLKPLKILDLCTGSGCISSFVLANLRVPHTIEAVDVSKKALKLAVKNCDRAIAHGTVGKINFHQIDVLNEHERVESLLQTSHVLLCNPPYISDDDFAAQTDISVRKYEPKLALLAKNGGNEFYYKFSQYIKRMLQRNAKDFVPLSLIVFEIGSTHQAKIVKSLFDDTNWQANIEQDGAHQDRVVIITRKDRRLIDI
ncbi:putative MRF1 mitochondrial N(5)-glutamine methyltransferase mtq1 [Schizosaccharomyces pombe]|uniref:Probable MRF1 mitochondrial N(5)-glutamine methyltransferase mtq1 n=1 Tax=Schizosaccharomyces pombe (strain 972 / ATCC 24843) TaxID=284812 RepID=MTQ1_SCHPO|nr:putative S-adenosylmethionine-dependent methyltransferase [Schizosaccharomyces pombe]O14028.1 RecName: Full=Probable MRF1 mitochondrial N(5)-glutamine methyltransferase mtq1 [Schizosaccharomyces pombe 972h-]CAB16250.1 mitochondrial S-adenosylmethionine-dependent methyltransferase (predicted) [Schizosaccharomyces pombe]|eukprot:NP_594983.1 putative S-adenosylmethionine-dependent methyltransferase [Schizosaccharomyces pombe]